MKRLLALILLVLSGCITPLQTTKDTVTGNGLAVESFQLTQSKALGPIDGAYESFAHSEWLRRIPLPTITSKTNAWDCDDYAFEAMVAVRKQWRMENKADTTPAIGVVVGIVAPEFLGSWRGGLHAMNIIHVKTNGWFFYEPQTGRTARMREAIQEKKFVVHWMVY